MEINGLPLHPLVVHAAVVLAPVAALFALAYVLVRPWRGQVRWPMAVLALLAVLAVVVAYLTGNNFLDSKPELRNSPQVQIHQDRANQLLWVAIGFGVIALCAAWVGSRRGALRVVLDVLLVLSAGAVLTMVVLTGDAGARAVWG